MKKLSVLIPTFKRNGLLRLNLSSLMGQPESSDIEVIVLDDDHVSDAECRAVAREFGATHVHSGSTKSEEMWRIPGFAINIGARLSKTDRLLICCAEMYHLNATIFEMLSVVDRSRVGIPASVKDDKGSVTGALDAGEPVSSEMVGPLRELDTKLPFFMGVHKRDFFDIGGYDEDFTGVCFDDDDFTERLVAHGCEYKVSDAALVHLHHPRLRYGDSTVKARWDKNKAMYEARKGVVLRNEGREWGKL
jgi:glycosyltransferase involved in cell wall biosynthesis